MNTATASKKFTAANVPALIALAIECGLEHTMTFGRKSIDFSTRAPTDGEFGPVSEDDDIKMENFTKRAGERFGDRAHFDACNRFRFVRCEWSKSVRTESQMNNVD